MIVVDQIEIFYDIVLVAVKSHKSICNENLKGRKSITCKPMLFKWTKKIDLRPFRFLLQIDLWPFTATRTICIMIVGMQVDAT
jgi:hypothetical protein